MKKLYSIVLMAAALLIGTNVSATKIAEMTIGGVTTDVENLWDAFRDLPANTTATFKMVADAEIVPGTGAASNNAKALWVNAGQNITLDLNGYVITSSARFNFGHASFTLTGQGVYNCSVSQAFNCYGSEDSNAPYGWSSITIGKDVTLNDPDGYAIGILMANGRPDAPASSHAGYKYSCGVQVDIYGKVISKWGVASNGTMVSNVGNIPVLNVHPSALVQGDNSLETIYGKSTDKKGSKGYSVWNAENAVLVTEGEHAGEKYYRSTDAALYCAGYMKYNIKGTVVGGVGVYVKAGEVNIEDATIMANSAEFWTPIGYSNGFIGAGSAVVFDSNKDYSANGMKVEVKGDTYVSSEAGYAIQETVTTSDKPHIVPADVNIESGTFMGATIVDPVTSEETTLCLVFTDELGEGIKEAGSISGGTFNSADDVQEYVNTSGDGIIVPVETATGTVYVVAEKPSGTSWVADLNAAAADAYVKLDAAGSTILSADKNIDYLNIAAAHTVIIPDGKTLTVGEIVLGDDAVIDVKAGGKLIVDGANGIIAFNANNLKIETSETAQAIFLLSPAVKSNRHPNATVQLQTYSWYESSTSYQWQRFGIPTFGAVTSFDCVENAANTQIQAFENGNWVSLGYIGGTPAVNVADLNKPFVTYNLIANRVRTADAPVYNIKGELVGNENASLNAYSEWNLFSNSYLAKVDVKAFLGDLAGVDQVVYIATPAGVGTYTWDAKDLEWAAGEKLNPMAAFILHNPGEAAISAINYEKAVYNPATKGSSNAPSRFAQTSDKTAKLRVIVANEEGVRDDVKMTEKTSNLHNAAKYMNDDLNIYAMADEKAAIVAAEDLENTYVGFSTVKGGNFTISFANVEGREFTLVDHATGARVEIAEGNTYEFTADANSANDYRFEIVGRQNMPTAIDNTEAVKSVKGVYTITGQYVGEMSVWNTLPAGVYVVNGEKRVK